MVSRSEPALSDIFDIAEPASTVGDSVATLLSTLPALNAMRGTSGAGGGRSRSTFCSRLLATSVSLRMRVNSMRVASRIPSRRSAR